MKKSSLINLSHPEKAARPAPPPTKAWIWFLIVLMAIIAALAALVGGAYYYLQNQWSPLNPEDTTSENFIVKTGQGPISIANQLIAQDLIRETLPFRLRLKILKAESQLQAGVFSLSPSLNTDEIIALLTAPPEQVSITILPGWRREEIASYLVGLELPNFDPQEFLNLTADSEGYLYPDTYFIFPTADAQDINNLLTSTFKSRILDEHQDEIAASGRTLNEVLTIASILQREAKTREQMQNIAAIIQNRLEIKMPLQFCATAQYASGYHSAEDSWWVEPTLADTQIDSPYNTYVTPGLPPGPIAAPSLTAIEAALDPIANDYLFYLHDPQGNIHYAKTNDQHNANKDQYLR